MEKVVFPQFQILFPFENQFVRWREVAYVLCEDATPRGPVCYVLANDGQWYRQAPAEKLSQDLYLVPCVFGNQFNRSGYNYVLAAVDSLQDLPPIAQNLPDTPRATVWPKVTRL